MERYDIIIVGAGPAGLSAAIEAAKAGMKPIVFDENEKPGGQLFKQIHKFFGSKEHKAKTRGINIGNQLLKEAQELGVEVVLNATVAGLYQEKEITVQMQDEIKHYKADSILIATGASENMVSFDGWTKPGVIGAGAAQTMMNLHYIKPGKRILMLGSGNVGLVVSYQLLQAGCDVVAVVDAAPRVGGYGVHASKIARCGVPFFLSHTIVKAEGKETISGVTIAKVGPDWKPVLGTEKHFDVDTICLAVGLSPMSQLLKQAGCKMLQVGGGVVPECDEFGETSINGVFVAGDVSGIEEASSAMIEGSIAGCSMAFKSGYMKKEDYDRRCEELRGVLATLREGMFAPQNRGKTIENTDEGVPISRHLLEHGYLSDDEVVLYPGVTKQAKIHPVIECTQNIPCNPCQDACPKGCIKVGSNITKLPAIDSKEECIGCGMCVASCSGQAIFLVDESKKSGYADITIPYEFLPLPNNGDIGIACDRSGKQLCEAEVVSIKSAKAFDQTHLLTMRVPQAMSMRARFYKGAGK